jgi:hypothetical protein
MENIKVTCNLHHSKRHKKLKQLCDELKYSYSFKKKGSAKSKIKSLKLLKTDQRYIRILPTLQSDHP